MLHDTSYSEKLKQTFQFYEDFWTGSGAYPISFARPHLAKERDYITYDLVEQHNDVDKLLEKVSQGALRHWFSSIHCNTLLLLLHYDFKL